MSFKAVLFRSFGGVQAATKFVFGLLILATMHVGMMGLFPSNTVLKIVTIFTLTPAFFLLVVFLHEVGHAIAAWLVNYRVHVIVIGRIGFVPAELKFIRVGREQEGEIAGFVSCSPKWPIKGRARDIVVSIAGPLATAILGIFLLYLDYREFLPKYSRRALPLLALACFMDSVFNLLPFKWGAQTYSDGLNIIKNLSKSKWTKDIWAQTRLFSYTYAQQEIVSDEEWAELRGLALKPHNIEENFEALLADVSWVKTDPEAFVAALDNMASSVTEMKGAYPWQYAASRILIGQYDRSLNALIPDMPPENNKFHPIYYFTKAILENAKGRYADSLEAIAKAKIMMKEDHGELPAEEKAIFTAIENKELYPELAWPRLPVKA